MRLRNFSLNFIFSRGSLVFEKRRAPRLARFAVTSRFSPSTLVYSPANRHSEPYRTKLSVHFLNSCADYPTLLPAESDFKIHPALHLGNRFY